MLPYKNLDLASDIEAKGFWNAVNTVEDIHCICSIDIATDEVYLFHDKPEFDNVTVVDPYDNKKYTIPKRKGSLQEGIEWWSKVTNNGSKLIVHNAHTYDRPICDKIWKDNNIPFKSWHDTFIQSKLQWFERPTPKGCKSPHGLKAYGILAGVNKPEVEDWSYLDAFKLHRCIEDCKIQKFTYEYLEKESLIMRDKCGANFKTALDIEALYADECFKQEIKGVLIDVEHATTCLADLDSKISKLTVEIEPQLPMTIKPKKGSKKVSRSEVANLLGFDAKNIVDKKVKKKSKGEVINVVDKPYVKPSVNFTNKADRVYYSGFNISYGETKEYSKLKDIREWIKKHYPETSYSDWNIEKTVEKGVVLDAHTCTHFECNPEDTDLIVGAHTRIEINDSKLSQSEVVKSFLIKLGWKDAEEWNLKTDIHDKKIKAEKDTWVYWPPKAHPDNQMKKLIKKGGYLLSSPKLSEEDYVQLPEGIGRKIAEYNTYVHRRNFLLNKDDPENKGILSYLDKDNRIPAGVNNFATRSGRGSQRVWVNAPSESALYGEEIRKCIIAPKGRKLVGIDMKSAQLSIAAYYANNFEYYNSVATGQETDENNKYVGQSAHCVNTRMFGMVSEDDWREAVKTQDENLIHKLSLIRKKSKGGSFAVIFGASGAKVGKTIGIPESEGNARKKQFLTQMGLDNTIEELKVYENAFKFRRGFMLPLAFGYWLYNDSSHKSVNTIVQGFEALAQKLAVIRLRKESIRLNLEDKFDKVLDVHDEVLLEVDEDYEDTVGNLAGECYTWAAEQIFKFHKKHPRQFANSRPPTFSIDLNGGFKVGDNYLETH
jgi:hypothetical protein